MTAAEVYESVTHGGASDFADVAAILNRNQPWCLIGGLAVNCYVEPVYTIDVDLVVMEKNLAQIQRELEAAGFVVQRFDHSTNAQRGGSKLNLQFTTDPRYQVSAAKANARFLELLFQLQPWKTLSAAKFGRGRMRRAA
jgi:hypothetical protein